MSGSSVMGAFRRAVEPTGLIWKGEQPPEPSTPPPPPDRTSEEVQAARADVKRRRRSLLLLNPTGGTGVTGNAPTTSRTLLGQG